MSQRANANTNQQGGGVGYLGQISTRNTRGCGLLGPMLHQYPDGMGKGMGWEMYTRYCANRMVIRYDSMRTQILCLILNEYQLILILYPYTAERRDVLENTPPEASTLEIAFGLHPRAISRASGCKIPALGKSLGPRGVYFPIHPSSRQCTDRILF